MSDKLYLNHNYNMNSMYTRPPCAGQIPDPVQQQYAYPNNVQVNNSYPQTMESYSAISTQSCHKSPNMCPTMNLYPDQLDVTNWESRIADVEKTLKMPDKFEMIEITSKDLSPASYCSNLDMLIPDFYKNKEVNYLNNTNWCTNTNYNSQKIDYPSCAQVNQNAQQIDKTVKYCSIQKTQDNYGFDLNYSEQCYYKNNKTVETQDYNMYYHNQSYYPQMPDNYQQLQLDQQTEGSNEESDIIVEESDDEITDYGDFSEKKIPYQINKCVICNISYMPLGTQFYFLTSESPLTMSSQKPVFNKIVEILGRCEKNNYLCSECLGLINTIDHLQLKLSGFNAELLVKFQKTCIENGLNPHRMKKKKNKKKRISLDKIPKFRCSHCKKILTFRKYCQFHLQRHKFRGFLCDICGKVFVSRKRFNAHYNLHRSKIPKIDSYKCSNCPKIFRTRSNLKEHANYCLGMLPFVCKHQFCDKKFASPTKLKNHIKVKHDKKFIAICSICNIGFIKISDYKSHMVSHSTDKKFSCTKCDKSYKTLSNLNFHMKIHADKLPFICSICDKGFMRKEYLDAHVNNHNGIKNFCCSICNKKFVSQKNLDSHIKYHDGSNKTKTCNICGKNIMTGFEEHLRIHNNLREFECDKCDMRFNTKGTLAKHKKKRHVQ